MRHLRSRVEQLEGDSAAEPSAWAYAAMNRQNRPFGAVGKESSTHPLAYSALLDRSVIAQRSMRGRRAPLDATSLWCEGWGATADETDRLKAAR